MRLAISPEAKASKDTFVPNAPNLEAAVLPNVDDLRGAVERLLRYEDSAVILCYKSTRRIIRLASTRGATSHAASARANAA
jgi:hypothetical protein